MARVRKSVVLDMAHGHWESYLRSIKRAAMLDRWVNGEQYDAEDYNGENVGRPYRPDQAGAEYDDLASRAPAPWAGLIVTSLAQTAYVDGVRLPGATDNLATWDIAQRNNWDKRQSPIHRAAIGMGAAYGLVLPGQDPLTGDKIPIMRGKSAKRMNAWYDSDDDEWCRFAMEAERYQPRKEGEDPYWLVTLYDENAAHYLQAKGEGWERKDWEYISHEPHPMRVPPIARCVNRIDLDGRATGEIEPVIPLLRRIDQDTMDRLVVQRFGAWKVRYIAGMAKPTSEAEKQYLAMKLKIEDLLISPDNQTKFGTLDATEISGFIEAHDADLRVLSAITQTPPHHLLGLSSNLQAEALAAAESGLQRKSVDFKTNAGEFHEQMFRMAATVAGHSAEARAFNMQVRWRDTESRSLNQAADALFKLAEGLHVPVEMLWERIPGWTDNDSERAKKLIEDGTIDKLLAELENEGDEDQGQGGAGGDDNAQD